MKNFIPFIVIVLLFSTTSFAQIQKNILGVSLGTTHYNKVKEMFPNAIGNWASDSDTACYPGSELDGLMVGGDPALNISSPKFAGIEWQYAHFSFYHGILYEVSFLSEYSTMLVGGPTPEAPWKELRRALSQKYGSYRKTQHDANVSDEILSYEIYSDGITRIVTFYTSTYYKLYYQHVNLFKKKFQNKIDPSEL